MQVHLAFEQSNGTQLYEIIDFNDITPELITEALEDCVTLYVFENYVDEKYGNQPATHFDPIAIYRKG